MSADAKNSFDELQKRVNQVPELAGNDAVKKSMAQISKLVNDDTNNKDIATFNEVFNAMDKAIPVFLNTNSSGSEIALKIIDVAEVVVDVMSVIPVLKAISEPLSDVIKMVGSILGAFGISKTTGYFKQLELIIKDALADTYIKSVNAQIAGAIGDLQGDHNMLASILSKTYDDPATLLTIHPDITVTYVEKAARGDISSAYSSIAGFTGKSSRNSWPAITGTYYHLSKLVAFKVLYALEGIAYFQLTEQGNYDPAAIPSVKPPDYLRTIEMYDQIILFMAEYALLSDPYFAKPTIVNAAITHGIYRFAEPDFKFVAKLNHLLSLGDDKFWPNGASQYTFKCTHAADHDNTKLTYATVNPLPYMCIRLATQYAQRSTKESAKKALTKSKASQTNREMAEANIAVGRMDFEDAGNLKHEHGSHGDYKTSDQHFSLLSQDDAAAYPPYRWKLEAMSSHLEYYYGSRYEERNYPFDKEENFYIFQVFPTADELKNTGNLFPNNWKSENPGNHTYIMIGSRNPANSSQELIWCDHDGTIFNKMNYYDIVYNKSHYGSPEHCLWFLLPEN